MKSTDYRTDIDGLRAVAVLAVVAYHAFPTTLRGGFVGVDVFFVISGFLITGIIHREMQRGTFSFIDFYARRARRIFPALIVVLFCVAAAGWVLLLPDEYTALGKHIAGGSAFSANILLLFEAGYFDVSSIYKPLLHLWSLGIEEQFYLIWPLLLLVATFFGIRASVVVLAVGVVSFFFSIYLTDANVFEAFYMPHSRFWEMAVGALLAVIARDLKLSLPARQVGASIGLVAVLAAILITREDYLFPAPIAVISVFGAGLLLCFAPGTVVGTLILSNPIARWFGLISYPLYLWHWPLLSFPAIVQSGQIERSIRIAAVVTAIILAAITYYFVENPIRRGSSLRMKAATLTAIMAILFAAGISIFLSGGLPQRPFVRETQLAQKQLDAGPLWQFTSNKPCLNRFPLQGVENYGWWFCMISKDAAPTVMLLGSSFANHLYPGIVDHPSMKNEVVLSIGTCEPSWIDESAAENRNGDTFSPCTPERRFAQMKMINDIITTHRLKLVIMAGMLSEPTPAYIEALRRRIDFVEAQGARVILVNPHLKSEYYVRGCFGRPFKDPAFSCRVPQSAADKIAAAWQPLIDKIQITNPSVTFVDPNSAYCDGSTCSFVQDGLPMFRDQYSHFSEYGSALVGHKILDDVDIRDDLEVNLKRP